MPNIFDLGLNFSDGTIIEGNTSWGAGFGDNPVFRFEVDGKVVITDMAGNILLTFDK